MRDYKHSIARELVVVYTMQIFYCGQELISGQLAVQ